MHHQLERRVSREHIDALGHVGNQVYVGWLLTAAESHSSAVGLDWPAYRALGGVFVVRRHEFDYLAPAFEGDALVIRTWIEQTTRVTSTRAYEVTRAATCLMRGRTVWAFVDLETGRPRRIPEAVRAAFKL